METYDEEIERLAMADADAQDEEWLGAHWFSARELEATDPVRWLSESICCDYLD